MTPDSSLYRLSRKALVWVARKLPLDPFEAEGGDFHVVEITDPEKIPESWRGSIPWYEPDRDNMYYAGVGGTLSGALPGEPRAR